MSAFTPRTPWRCGSIARRDRGSGRARGPRPVAAHLRRRRAPRRACASSGRRAGARRTRAFGQNGRWFRHGRMWGACAITTGVCFHGTESDGSGWCGRQVSLNFVEDALWGRVGSRGVTWPADGCVTVSRCRGLRVRSRPRVWSLRAAAAHGRGNVTRVRGSTQALARRRHGPAAHFSLNQPKH